MGIAGPRANQAGHRLPTVVVGGRQKHKLASVVRPKLNTIPVAEYSAL